MPTGPTFPPSTVSNPGTISSGSSRRRAPNRTGPVSPRSRSRSLARSPRARARPRSPSRVESPSPPRDETTPTSTSRARYPPLSPSSSSSSSSSNARAGWARSDVARPTTSSTPRPRSIIETLHTDTTRWFHTTVYIKTFIYTHTRTYDAYCTPHILYILKTLIPTPPPARPRALASRWIDRARKTSHPDSPGNHVRFHRLLRHRGPRARSASPRVAPPAPRSPAAPSSRDTPSPWKPRRARKRSSARTTRTSSTRPRYDARLARDSTRDARTRATPSETYFFCVCPSIARSTDAEDRRVGGRERGQDPSRGESRSRSISIHIHLGVDRTGRAFGGRAFGARASTDDFYARASLPSSRRRPASTFRTRAARAPAPRARARSRCVRRHRTNPRGGLCEGL